MGAALCASRRGRPPRAFGDLFERSPAPPPSGRSSPLAPSPLTRPVQLKESQPTLTLGEVGKATGEAWKELTDKVRRCCSVLGFCGVRATCLGLQF